MCCYYSLIAETKKDPSVDLTKVYNNVVNNITAAEHAAKMAEKAANDTLEVHKHTHLYFSPYWFP